MGLSVLARDEAKFLPNVVPHFKIYRNIVGEPGHPCMNVSTQMVDRTEKSLERHDK